MLLVIGNMAEKLVSLVIISFPSKRKMCSLLYGATYACTRLCSSIGTQNSTSILNTGWMVEQLGRSSHTNSSIWKNFLCRSHFIALSLWTQNNRSNKLVHETWHFWIFVSIVLTLLADRVYRQIRWFSFRDPITRTCNIDVKMVRNRMKIQWIELTTQL